MKLKDKKIEILSVTNTKDPDGFPVETLTPIAPPLWAYFRQLSGREVYGVLRRPRKSNLLSTGGTT